MWKKRGHRNSFGARGLWAPWLSITSTTWAPGQAQGVPFIWQRRSELLQDPSLLLGLDCLFDSDKNEHELLCCGFVPGCELNVWASFLPKSCSVMGSGCHSNRLLKISKKFSAHGKTIHKLWVFAIGKAGRPLFLSPQFNRVWHRGNPKMLLSV